MTTPTTVELGALAEPLTKQLDGLILTAELELLELDNRAITRLLLRGYINATQARKARDRLLKKIQTEARLSAAAFNGANKESNQA